MHLNTVVEEHSFMKKIEKLKSKHPRIYEIKDAIIWVLVRNPMVGEPLSNDPNYRVHETSPLDTEAAKFWILYRYDQEKEKIYLLSIMPVPEQDEEKQKNKNE